MHADGSYCRKTQQCLFIFTHEIEMFSFSKPEEGKSEWLWENCMELELGGPMIE